MNRSFFKSTTIHDRKEEIADAISTYHRELMGMYEAAMKETPNQPFTSGIMELYCQRATYSSDREGCKNEHSHKNWLHMSIFEELVANQKILKRVILSKNKRKVLHNVYMLQEKPNHTDEMIIDDINQFKMSMSFPKNTQFKEIIEKNINRLNKLLSTLKPVLKNSIKYDILVDLLVKSERFSDTFLRKNYKTNNSDIVKLEYILTSHNYITKLELQKTYIEECNKNVICLKQRYTNQLKNYHDILQFYFPETCID
tara:strand:- start:634 stop:1401 length:768 start_codon:yes stop_codon:yes gene_type:complete